MTKEEILSAKFNISAEEANEMFTFINKLESEFEIDWERKRKLIHQKEDYKIIKGDSFKCIKDFIMDDKSIDYSKGKIYTSELDGCITDKENHKNHKMEDQKDFFKHFEYIYKTFEYDND